MNEKDLEKWKPFPPFFRSLFYYRFNLSFPFFLPLLVRRNASVSLSSAVLRGAFMPILHSKKWKMKKSLRFSLFLVNCFPCRQWHSQPSSTCKNCSHCINYIWTQVLESFLPPTYENRIKMCFFLVVSIEQRRKKANENRMRGRDETVDRGERKPLLFIIILKYANLLQIMKLI